MTLSESWTPLDIDTEEPAIPVRPGPGQNVVGMVATPSARARGWTRRAAVEICRGWAQDGSRILLCDVAFEDPELHEVAGLYNQEGVSDALMFGSSFRRLGQPLADGFFLATAGTAVPDPAALRAHPRWHDFAGGFTEAGAVLVLYLPSDAPGVDALYELCDTVVVLGERDEVGGLSLSSALGPLATFGPHPDEGVPAAALGTGLDSAGDPVVDADESIREGVPVQQATDVPGTFVPAGAASPDLGAGTGPQTGVDEGVAATEASPIGDGRGEKSAVASAGSGVGNEPSRGMGGTLVWGAVALLVLAVVLNMAGVIQLPGGGADAASSPDVESGPPETQPAVADAGSDAGAEALDTGTSANVVAQPGTVEGPRGVESAPVARFVLALASYETLSAAFGDVVTLRRSMPEAHLVISPVRLNGEVWYRMSAGAGETTAEIVDLRNRLAAVRPEAAGWRVREAALSFLVDEYPSFAEADERVSLLAEQGIPGHILRHVNDDGMNRFRVYAGAYRTPAEARYLSETLQAAAPELQDLLLVERRGFRPE